MPDPNPEIYEYDDPSGLYADFAENSFSWNHMELPYIDEHWRAFLANSGRVLDIGCGSGRMMNYLQSIGLTGDRIIGVEPSDTMLGFAHCSIPEAQLIQAVGQALPLRPEAFDAAVCNMVLHNMDGEGASAMLEAVSDGLPPGGRFFFIDTNPNQDPDNLKIGEWVVKETPWGAQIRAYQHDYPALFDTAEKYGLSLKQLEYPMPTPESEQVNPEEYKRYSEKPFRIMGILEKDYPF